MSGMVGTGKSGIEPTEDAVDGRLEVREVPECSVPALKGPYSWLGESW